MVSANLPLQKRNDILDGKIQKIQLKLKDTTPIPDIYEHKLKLLEKLENKWDTHKTVTSIDGNFSNNIREGKDPNICMYCAREVSEGSRVCSSCRELHKKEGFKKERHYNMKKCSCGNHFTPSAARQQICDNCKQKKEKEEMGNCTICGLPAPKSVFGICKRDTCKQEKFEACKVAIVKAKELFVNGGIDKEEACKQAGFSGFKQMENFAGRNHLFNPFHSPDSKGWKKEEPKKRIKVVEKPPEKELCKIEDISSYSEMPPEEKEMEFNEISDSILTSLTRLEDLNKKRNEELSSVKKLLILVAERLGKLA